MTLGGQVIGFIECLKVPEGALVGQLIKLDDFQKKFILDIYDNPRGTTQPPSGGCELKRDPTPAAQQRKPSRLRAAVS